MGRWDSNPHGSLHMILSMRFCPSALPAGVPYYSEESQNRVGKSRRRCAIASTCALFYLTPGSLSPLSTLERGSEARVVGRGVRSVAWRAALRGLAPARSPIPRRTWIAQGDALPPAGRSTAGPTRSARGQQAAGTRSAPSPRTLCTSMAVRILAASSPASARTVPATVLWRE